MFVFFSFLWRGKFFKISDHNQCTKDRKSISESFFTSLCLYLEEEFPTLLAEDSCLFLSSMFFFFEMQAALVALIGTDVALVMYLVAVLSVHPGINVATRQETPYALQATTAVIT